MKTKPFNLEAALNGAKVIARNGESVTGISLFDYSEIIYALVGCTQRSFTRNGEWDTSDQTASEFDLFLLDESEDSPVPPVAAPVRDDLQYRIALRILSELKPDGDRSYNEALMHAANIVRGFK